MSLPLPKADTEKVVETDSHTLTEHEDEDEDPEPKAQEPEPKSDTPVKPLYLSPAEEKKKIRELYQASQQSSIKRFTRTLREKHGLMVSEKQVKAALKGFKTITDDQIRQMYKDPKMGLQGLQVFEKKLKEKGFSFAKGQLERALAEDPTRDVMTPRRFDKKNQMPVWANEDGQYMADLAFIPRLKKANKNFSVILTIINLNTNKAYAYALKTKGESKSKKKNESLDDKDVKGALSKFFKEADPKPTILQTDDGVEFRTTKIRELYAANGVSHYILTSAQKHHAQGPIERFNRTLKQKLEFIMKDNENNNWVDHLQEAIKNYNDTANRGNPQTTAPDDMDEELIMAKRIGRRMKAFKILQNDNFSYKGEGGDNKLKDTKVRIATRLGKTAFSKAAAPWSDEIYTVVGGVGLGYILEDSDGKKVMQGRSNRVRKFMPYELKATNTRAINQKRAAAVKKYEAEKKIAEEGIEADKDMPDDPTPIGTRTRQKKKRNLRSSTKN